MTIRLQLGDCREILRTLPAESVHCCVTSPPYFGLRDYGHDGQIGLESTPAEYVAKLVEVFREVRRVLRDDGTLWLNLGDSYAASISNNGGYSEKSTLAGFTSANTKGRVANEAGQRRKLDHGVKQKDLLGIPWRVAFALQADGWYLRSDIIWHKPNPMPESVTDRPTKAHEYVFLMSKSPRYYYDADSIRQPISSSTIERWGDDPYSKRRPDGQPTHAQIDGEQSCGVHPGGPNKRTVWTVPSAPFAGAHFATFPPDLIEPCIKAGCPEGGTVLDPFGGAGTTGLVADRLQRNALLIELNPDYVAMTRHRIYEDAPLFTKICIGCDDE